MLDRTNGELISADPYVYVNWATHVDLKTGRPVETPFSRYKELNAQIFPSPFGGHNWQPMSYNPITNLVYIPARDQSWLYGQPAQWTEVKDRRIFNIALGFDKNGSTRMDTLAPEEKGKLIAWDPIQRKEVWSVAHKSIWNAGVLSTSDLVFQGTAEGYLVAYDAADGTELWRHDVQSGVIAPPVTYVVDGRQYVSIVAGWGGVGGRSVRYTDQRYPGTLYTFALGEKEPLPTYPLVERKLIDLEVSADSSGVARGSQHYNQHCARCHGNPGGGGGAYPDLTYSDKSRYENFYQIVGQGALLPLGMPNFGDRLNASQIEEIKNYILSASRDLRAQSKTQEQTKGNIH